MTDPLRATTSSEAALLGQIQQLQARVAALEFERRSLQDVIEKAPVMISIMRGPDFVYESVNPAFQALAPGKKILGRRFAEVWSELPEPLIESLQNVFATGEPFHQENAPYTIERGPGMMPEMVYVSYSWISLPDAEGKPDRVLTLAHEVTGAVRQRQQLTESVEERKRAEDALRESLERLEKVLQVETVGVMFWDLNTGCMVDANNTFLRMTGYSREEVEARELTWQKLTPPEYIGISREEVDKFLATGRVGPYEKEYFCKDGSRRWLLFAGSSLGNNQCVEFCVDISARKQAEMALREGEERFRMLADNMSQFAWMADAEGSIFWYNQRWFEYTGMTPEQMQNGGWREVQHPDHIERVVARIKESFATGEPWEDSFPLRGRDGSYRWFLSRALPIFDRDGKVVRWFGTNTDITESRNAEEELERNRRMMAEAEALAGACSWEWDLRTGRWAFSDQWHVIHGTPKRALRTEELLPIAHPDDRAQVTHALERAREGIAPYDLEHRIIRQDTGEIRVIRAIGRFVRDAAGKVVKLYGFGQDITERKQAEHALSESESQFRTLANAIPQLCWMANADGWIFWYNDRWYQYTGTTPQQMEGWGWRSVHDPGALPDVLDRWQRSIASGEPFDMTFPLRGADGVFRPFLTRVMPVRDRDGKVVRWFGTNTDISEQQAIQQKLRESEAKMRAVFRSLVEGIVFLNASGEVEEMNEPVETLRGHRLQELTDPELQGRRPIVRTDGTTFPADSLPGMVALRTGQPVRDVEMGVPAGNGSLQWKLGNAQPVRDEQGKLLGAVASFFDITDRKRAEEQLRASEERFRSLAFATSHAIWIIGPDGVVTADHPNPSWQEFTGQTAEEVMGLGWLNAIHPDDQARIAETWCDAVGTKSLYIAEYRLWRHDGEYRWMAARGTPLLNKDGSVREWIGTSTDITERKIAEAALADSEKRYRALFESVQEAFVLGEMILEGEGQPRDWRFLDVNPYFEKLYGRKREQVVGRTCREVLPAPESDSWIELAARVTVTGQSEPFASRTSTGLYLEGAVYRPQPGQFAAILMDATARREAQDQIRQLNAELEDRVRTRTAQLEAANKELEAFSYSVSHDLRAPLRGIDGWSLALMEDFGAQLDGKARDYLDLVRSEAQRMGTLIDDMLQLSRITRLQIKSAPVDLTAIAQTVAGRLRLAHPGRRIDFVIAQGLNANGDAGLLEIALTNLLGNAVKFTGQREDARIEFGLMKRDGERTFFVRDNGVGFNMASAGKLFGAFQRLHRASQFPGTGIGLATVQRIIHRHGGRVWADAERGQGASFYFTLDSK